MIFLDTHALIFLAADQQRIPHKVWHFLDADDLVCSPMARLELDFLYEIGRIKEDPRAIMALLAQDHGVLVETDGWVRAPEIAATLSWTRDPFDRLITAHALTWAAPLLTRDGEIRDNYNHAFWDQPPVYQAAGSAPPG
jgi:PIN domain nuclease of toxin-antitoxin system